MIKEREKIFLNELLNLVNTIQNMEDTSKIHNILSDINELYSKIPDKTALWRTMDAMCEGISKEYFILLEYLYLATHDEYIINKQLKLLETGIGREEIDLFYAIFYKWQMTSRIFLNYNFNSMYIERRNLQRTLRSKLQQLLNLDLPFIEEPNNNRIVVISTQLLNLKHGPTRNIMDYCYTLQKRLNKEVFLFITCEMPSDRNTIREYMLHGIDCQLLNCNVELDGGFSIEYQGEVFKGYQCQISRNRMDETRNIIQAIHEWKPFLIYDISAENLIADICSTFTTAVSIPCAYDFPISEEQFLILPRTIEESDKEIVDYIRERSQNIIESIYVYKIDEPVTIHRKTDYGFVDDEFVVAIVGTRLHYEIDQIFIGTIRKILEQDEKISVAFIGLFDTFNEVKEDIGYEDRVKYLGYQEDVRGILNIANLYLNPPRKGGGTSAVEAMAEGIPIITLPNCDVNYASENQFLCESLEDMPELVKRYKNDADFYNVQSQKARAQAKKVVNTEKILSEIINYIHATKQKEMDDNEKSRA